MGWLNALVQRSLRSFKRCRVEPSEVRHTPNVNQLWYAWVQAFGSKSEITDAAAVAHDSGLRHIQEYQRNADPAVLEKAIQDLRQAVNLTALDWPHRPMYLSDLGGALRERFIRKPQGQVDLDQMVKLFEEAHGIIEHNHPFRPTLANNLGNAYHLRHNLDRDPDDLDREIACYEEALSEGTDADIPSKSGWQNNLANALVKRVLRDDYHENALRKDDLYRAIRLAHDAAADLQSDPDSRSKFLSSLAHGLMIRFQLENNIHDLDQVVAISGQALSLSQNGSLDRAGLLFNAGLAFLNRYYIQRDIDDLTSAISAWEEAWSIVNKMFFRSSVAYKLGQQQQWTNLATGLVSAYCELLLADPRSEVQINALWRAFELIEASKSRLLVELLGRAETPPPANASNEDLLREREILRTLTELDTQDLVAEADPCGTQTSSTITDQILAGVRTPRFMERRRFVEELEKIWANIAVTGPEGEAYVAFRRGEPLKTQELTCIADQVGSETLLMSLFPLLDRTILLAFRSGWDTPLAVPLPLVPGDWLNCRDHLFEEIHDFDKYAPVREEWDARFRQTIEDLQREPVAGLMKGIQRVVVAPFGIGHLIPWAVLTTRAGWRDKAGQPIPIVTVPAFSVLSHRQHRHHSAGPSLIVGYGGTERRLLYVEDEARIVGRILKVEPLLGSEANKQEVLNRLSDASIAHFAVHGRFVQRSPLESGIKLFDGYLSAHEIMRLRLNTDLVVLSACETGAIKSLGSEEFIGLGQSFLQAGARSIVVSLWRVEDESTCVLMRNFYEALQNEDKATALSRAMNAVRADPRWSHPYYWGPFFLSGDWNTDRRSAT